MTDKHTDTHSHVCPLQSNNRLTVRAHRWHHLVIEKNICSLSFTKNWLGWFQCKAHSFLFKSLSVPGNEILHLQCDKRNEFFFSWLNFWDDYSFNAIAGQSTHRSRNTLEEVVCIIENITANLPPDDGDFFNGGENNVRGHKQLSRQPIADAEPNIHTVHHNIHHIGKEKSHKSVIEDSRKIVSDEKLFWFLKYPQFCVYVLQR